MVTWESQQAAADGRMCLHLSCLVPPQPGEERPRVEHIELAVCRRTASRRGEFNPVIACDEALSAAAYQGDLAKAVNR